LSEWADAVLQRLGFAERVRRASTIEEVRLITFGANAVEVVLAIREALHPGSGRKAAHFKGLNDGGLKRILKKQFHELKKQREQELRDFAGQSGQSGQTAAHDWTDDLQLDNDAGVLPLLANLILFLCHHPEWMGVLGFNRASRAGSADVSVYSFPTCSVGPWGLQRRTRRARCKCAWRAFSRTSASSSVGSGAGMTASTGTNAKKVERPDRGDARRTATKIERYKIETHIHSYF
jgi:hypothetical protein